MNHTEFWPVLVFFLNHLFSLLCPELTCFDEKGNKTNVPDKARQIEAFQLLFMLLPPTNRSLLKLLLDLLYHTARSQNMNKMSAINLATMFAPHIIWPKNVRIFSNIESISESFLEISYYIFLIYSDAGDSK